MSCNRLLWVQLGNCESMFAGMLLKHFRWELLMPFFRLFLLRLSLTLNTFWTLFLGKTMTRCWEEKKLLCWHFRRNWKTIANVMIVCVLLEQYVWHLKDWKYHIKLSNENVRTKITCQALKVESKVQKKDKHMKQKISIWAMKQSRRDFCTKQCQK